MRFNLSMPGRNTVWFSRLIFLRSGYQSHFKKYWHWWLIAICMPIAFQFALKIGINVTESLPEKAFLVTKLDRTLHRGDYVSFTWHGAGPYQQGLEFVKIVRGLPGDTVEFKGRDVFINGQYIATAKEYSRQKRPLALGPEGVIPQGRYFVFASHHDSLDSRYALTGWIDEKNVIGRAYPIF
jgi:conjugal transfer pilin signal peptidase TrbI